MSGGKFTADQVKVFKEQFRKADINNDGVLNAKELETILMDGFNYKPKSKTEIEYLLKQAGKSGMDATLTFEEFLAVAEQTVQTENSFLRLRANFKMFDKNGDGFISLEELFETLRSADASVSRDDAEKMFLDCDVNGDGRIDYDEFIKLMMTKL